MDPACPPLVSGEIAFPVRAEATEVAEWKIKRLVPPEKFFIPFPEGCKGRKGGRAFRFRPFFIGKLPDGEFEIPDIPDI